MFNRLASHMVGGVSLKVSKWFSSHHHYLSLPPRQLWAASISPYLWTMYIKTYRHSSLHTTITFHPPRYLWAIIISPCLWECATNSNAKVHVADVSACEGAPKPLCVYTPVNRQQAVIYCAYDSRSWLHCTVIPVHVGEGGSMSEWVYVHVAWLQCPTGLQCPKGLQSPNGLQYPN